MSKLCPDANYRNFWLEVNPVEHQDLMSLNPETPKNPVDSLKLYDDRNFVYELRKYLEIYDRKSNIPQLIETLELSQGFYGKKPMSFAAIGRMQGRGANSPRVSIIILIKKLRNFDMLHLFKRELNDKDSRLLFERAIVGWDEGLSRDARVVTKYFGSNINSVIKFIHNPERNGARMSLRTDDLMLLDGIRVSQESVLEIKNLIGIDV